MMFFKINLKLICQKNKIFLLNPFLYIIYNLPILIWLIVPHIPNILLSSLCSFIASIIVRFICLGERDISKIIVEKNIENRKILAEKAKKCANIKLIVLYIASGCLLFLCWYYVSAFCAVFKNSQKNYLINTLLSFIVCNLWPCVTTFIPTIMRRKAIQNNSETLYKVSQYIF